MKKIERRLTLDQEATGAGVLLSFEPLGYGRTFRDYTVRITLEGDGIAHWTTDIVGADGVQALQLALKIAAAKIEALEEFKVGRLYWLDPDMGHGLSSS